jgi:hypothetical protein
MWADTTLAHHARAGMVLPSDSTDADWVLLEPFLLPPSCVALSAQVADAPDYPLLMRGGLP